MATKAEILARILTERQHKALENPDYRWGVRVEDAWTLSFIPPYKRLDGIRHKAGQRFAYTIEPGNLTAQIAEAETYRAGLSPEWDLTPRATR
jgi:hypothetical protein